MKKISALLLVLVLVAGLAAGCGKAKESDEKTNPTTAPAADTADPTTAPATDDSTTDDSATTAAAKTGLAVITSIGKSKDASADADGLAQVDSTIVAVLVGQDGKILDCKIDAAQTKVNFSAEGKLVTDIGTVFKSKQELGTEYGMAKASSLSKEWNEQANSFAAYVIGKTMDEVKGIALTEDSVPTEADLAATVTIKLNTYIAAMEKAVASAQELGAVEGDQLGLGLTTDIAKSKDASADAEGLAQAYTNISVITVGADGKITSCITDSVQGNVKFSATGAITTDLATAALTKLDLKEEYGMKKASGISKEWYEQANAFSAYVTGKTMDEVKGISLTEEGVPADVDLAASVSVHVGPFIMNMEKASVNAAQ